MTRVTVTSGGHLTLTDGTTTTESSSVVVGSNPFVFAIVRDSALSSTKLYVDGALAVTIASSVDVGATPTLTLGPGKAQAGYTLWFDDVRIKAAAITAANTLLYGWKEMFAADQTVTYGFRISNNEGLQLVKVRGSGGLNGWVGTNPSPNTVTSGNTMGAIGSATASVITENQMSF
eukprot:jgi/Mesvir1/1475/Mv25485-RA.1